MDGRFDIIPQQPRADMGKVSVQAVMIGIGSVLKAGLCVRGAAADRRKDRMAVCLRILYGPPLTAKGPRAQLEALLLYQTAPVDGFSPHHGHIFPGDPVFQRPVCRWELLKVLASSYGQMARANSV